MMLDSYQRTAEAATKNSIGITTAAAPLGNRSEIEAAVIVGLLNSPLELPDVLALIGPEHFAAGDNRQLFSVIAAVWDSNVRLSLDMLYSRLPIETDKGIPWRAVVPALLLKYDGVRSPADYVSLLEALDPPIPPMDPMDCGVQADLFVDGGNLPKSATALRDLLAGAGCFFERDVPVQVVNPADGATPSASPLTKHGVTIAAHRLARPINDRGRLVTLPERVACMYLDMRGEWKLPPLVGIATAPLLADDGAIRIVDGYDANTGLYCARTPKVTIPEIPTIDEARSALFRIRHAFRTFPFADSRRGYEAGVEVVDLAFHPDHDESAFVLALMTAVCRASLWLAPGALFTAPAVSGAGTGKGLLVRSICAVAFGVRPRAFTTGGKREELDKRIAAELVEAQPVLFLDNANGVELRSDALASVLTERPARVRILGQTRMATLNSAAWIAVTGNGLSVTEDLARRFMLCELDAHCEDPEKRPFESGFLDSISASRSALLSDVLMIWRWGRQCRLERGLPLGSYETWATWCRDPLLALGCSDPVARIDSLKANDPKRRNLLDIFDAWNAAHGAKTMKASELADSVKVLIDPHGSRQAIATKVANMAGTRAGGYMLNKHTGEGKWSVANYSVARTP